MASKEISQERSVSVQGRVDIVKLAEVFAAVEMQKYNVRTMSLLVSYCVDIAHSALEQNGLLDKRMDGIGSAYYLLIDSGLMTRSMKERNEKKVHMAWGFENIRKEGGDPAIEAPGYYKMMHNHRSVDVPDDRATKAKALEMLEYADSVQKQKDAEETEKRMIERKKKYNLDENGAIIPKSVITPKLECPAPATDIPDEAATEKPDFKKQGLAKYQAWKLEQQRKQFEEKQARTSKGASDIPRQKTDEEIQADFDRIANKDKELMAALDKIGQPVN